eukprot:CAMPEP_0173434056 /NCGR_PEP_ID=MMETSP1357-20121228/11711_1 /TAXON_ID=77926 /ORGANISM="Hemiselmis rufescens, Strain PCC563" /LENGTH=87 /DNA_ID=CAMNT_0014398855 /DNA_START=1 /DNA_END=264 /DNA_ORIENTATION=+
MMPGRYLRTYQGPAQTVGTVQAPTPYTQPMPTTQYTQPMPMATQPMATTMPYGYGGYGSMMAPAYGVPTMSAARSSYQPPADDAISA